MSNKYCVVLLFLFCFCFYFCCCCLVWPVLPVYLDVFDCPFDILYRLFPTIWLGISINKTNTSSHWTFLHQYNWPPRYNWNIVKRGVKHHNHPPFVAMNNKICLSYHHHLIECNFISHHVIAEHLLIWR